MQEMYLCIFKNLKELLMNILYWMNKLMSAKMYLRNNFPRLQATICRPGGQKWPRTKWYSARHEKVKIYF